MAYYSKHTGLAIDNGIDINDTQNNRLNNIENNNDIIKQSINEINTLITNLTNNINEQQKIINEQQLIIDELSNNLIKINFAVVGGTTQPSNPTENMIWINTSNIITSFIFRSTKPNNPSEGQVWIQTGSSGNIMLDRLIINNITIDETYPSSAHQYLSGTWVNKDAYGYQNKQWLPLIQYVYYYGDQCSYLTNGWGYVNSGWTSATIDSSGTIIFIGKSCGFSTNKKINKGSATKLYIHVSQFNTTELTFILTTTLHGYSSSDTTNHIVITGTGNYYIDLTNWPVDFYVEMYCYYSGTVSVDKIWFE